MPVASPADLADRSIEAPFAEALPSLILDSGDDAWRRYIEFFTAHIRNKNTRAAYAHAVSRFCRWCEVRDVRALRDVSPFVVAGYIEELTRDYSAPTIKQSLAAIRMLFDFLVTGQVIPVNPAASVRGPRYVVKKGKTPVLSREEARKLLNSIDTNTIDQVRICALHALNLHGGVVGIDDHKLSAARATDTIARVHAHSKVSFFQ